MNVIEVVGSSALVEKAARPVMISAEIDLIHPSHIAFDHEAVRHERSTLEAEDAGVLEIQTVVETAHRKSAGVGINLVFLRENWRDADPHSEDRRKKITRLLELCML